MKLADLIPSTGALAGIEKQLQSRRYSSRWSFIVATVSVLVGVVSAYHGQWPSLPNKVSLHQLSHFVVSPAFVFIVAASYWVLARYTGFLFKQSKEPFRYTFCILDFQPVEGTPGNPFSHAWEDLLKLLRSDLTERLNRRVGRLSFLRPAEGDDAHESSKNPSLSSHFHIEGDYAVREDMNEGGWMIQVWPRVRIGTKSNPFTLAFPVRFKYLEPGARRESSSLPGSSGSAGSAPQRMKTEVPESSGTLGVEEYQRLLERVYSSVATEIYKQIEIDLRDKMALFPSESLRALARYNEAQDFENSSTIDAYDRALAMYRLSLDALKASWSHRVWTGLGRLPLWLLKWEGIGIRAAMQAEAKTRLGYSRCLIYRSLVSALAGRERNPIFEVRNELGKARELLARCYNSTMEKKFRLASKATVAGEDDKQNEDAEAVSNGAKQTSDPEAVSDVAEQNQAAAARRPSHATLQSRRLLLTSLSFPDPAPWRPRRKQRYEDLREELSRAFAVSALAHSLFCDPENAGVFAKKAEALADPRGSNRGLLHFVRAQLKPELEASLTYLGEAVESDPKSEIFLYRLAKASDLLVRDREEITPERVNDLIRKYDSVLETNPGNIASLVSQGYLFWLASDFENAKRKLKAGIELQEIVRETFVGDLKYSLARVEAEESAELVIKIKNQIASDRPFEELRSEEKAIITNANDLANQAMSYYQEAVLSNPAVALSYVATGGRTVNAYFERINRSMLERYEKFAQSIRTAKDAVIRWQTKAPKSGPSLVTPLICALAYAQNDCGNAYLNYYLRFDVESRDRRTLDRALGCLKEACDTLDEASVAGYNLFCALTWSDAEEDRERTIDLAGKLLTKELALPAAAVVSVIMQRDWYIKYRIDELVTELKNLEREYVSKRSSVRKFEEDVKNLKIDVEGLSSQGTKLKSEIDESSPGGDEDQTKGGHHPTQQTPSIGYSSASAAGPQFQVSGIGINPSPRGSDGARITDRESIDQIPRASGLKQEELDQKQKEFDQKRGALHKEKDNFAKWEKRFPETQRDLQVKIRNEQAKRSLQASALSKLVEKTRLAPFSECLGPDPNRKDDGISRLLSDKSVDWARFGDQEAFALAAVAQLWAVQEHMEESFKVCTHVREKYWQEDVSVINSLIELTGDLKELSDNIQRTEKDIEKIYSALKQYEARNNRMPEQNQGLDALVSRPTYGAPTNWVRLMDSLPEDPWNKPYQYRNPGVDVYSLGPGKETESPHIELSDGPFKKWIKSKDWLKEQKDHIKTAEKAFKCALEVDPKSSYLKHYSRDYKLLRLSNIDRSVQVHCKDGVEEFNPESDYEKAIAVFQKESGLDEIPDFHYKLGCAFENCARKLCENQKESSDRYKEVLKHLYKEALKHLQEACELDPEQQEYRSRWSSQWAAIHGLDERLKKFLPPSPIEMEIAQETSKHLRFEEGPIPPQLGERLKQIRRRLKHEMGFRLPIILFRDDRYLAKGEYRFLIRGVPLTIEKLPELSEPEDQLNAMAQQIENYARRFVAHFYSLQEVYSSLGKVIIESSAAAEIRENPEEVSELAWVLKSLLGRQISIADFDRRIVPQFRRCRFKQDLASTLDSIRVLGKPEAG